MLQPSGEEFGPQTVSQSVVQNNLQASQPVSAAAQLPVLACD
jgi:hypothetical protein